MKHAMKSIAFRFTIELPVLLHQADPVNQHVLSWLVHKVKLMVALTLKALLIKLPILISLLAVGWGREKKKMVVAEQKASPKSTQGAFKTSQ